MIRIKLLCDVTIGVEERFKLASESEYDPGDVKLPKGAVVEIEDALAEQLLDSHAELADKPPAVESAAKAAPEKATKPRARPRKPAKE